MHQNFNICLTKKITKNKLIEIIIKIAVYILLIDLAYVFLYPVLHMIITSFKSPTDLLDSSVTWLISEFYTENYKLAWSSLGFPLHFANTLLLVSLCTLGHVLSCSYIGYGFARFKFPMKDFFFIILLLAIIIPPQSIIIPVYMIFSKVGLSNQLAIILPTWLGFGLKGALFIFLFRQNFLSLPPSLEEAASIDGCGPIKTFIKIVLPASKSSIIVCIVLSIVWHWNDYFEPSIYITQNKNYLLPMLLPGLYDIIQKSSTGDISVSSADLSNLFTEGVVMAATFLVIIPVFIMYIFMQRKFVQGIEQSGLTGE